VRPIDKAPQWVQDYLLKDQPLRPHPTPRFCCQGFVRLSCNAVLVFCNNRQHVTADKYRGLTRIQTGFVLKRFPRPGWSPVIKYRMRFSRALKARRPLIDHYANHSPLRAMGRNAGWPHNVERSDFKAAPLTDEEWMLATAVMYFLEKWP
jgi:hypothetical protein